jgi:formiminotetrahydrofolate cyclodeaminase
MFRIIAAGVVTLVLAAPRVQAQPEPARDVGPNTSDPIKAERARADLANAAVEADARRVDLAVQQVAGLKTAWDRAVANGHPDEAGRLAQAHAAALVQQHRAEKALRNARANLQAIRDQLNADEHTLQTK